MRASRRHPRYALLNQCSGKERVTWEERTPVIGAAALAAGLEPHQERPELKRRCPTRRANGTAQISQATMRGLSALELRAAWKRGALGREMPVADGWCVNRTVMCLVSVCAMLNATDADRGRVEHVSIVDEDTPQHILDLLKRLGVRLVDLSNATFPTYFNNASAALLGRGGSSGTLPPGARPRRTDPSSSLLPLSLTFPPSSLLLIRRDRCPGPRGRPQPLLVYVTPRWNAKPKHLTRPHSSSHPLLAMHPRPGADAPNCWQKLWVWNLTEYDKILWYDPDTLAIGNVYRKILQPTPAFGVLSYPKSRYLNTGVMVIEPSEQLFRELWRIWHEGAYPYVRGRSGGDDDQNFFQDIVYGRRVGGLRLHPLSPCHNDKSGRAKGCDPERVTLYHKTPLWEAARERALWQAALAGRCAGNPELQNWEYPRSPIETQQTWV